MSFAAGCASVDKIAEIAAQCIDDKRQDDRVVRREWIVGCIVYRDPQLRYRFVQLSYIGRVIVV